MTSEAPQWELSVPRAVWDRVAEAVSPGFADAYLYGARIANRQLFARTRTGYRALKRVSQILEGVGLKLVEPPLFQDSNQAPVKDSPPLRYRGE